MTIIEKTKRVLADVCARAKARNKATGFCIGNTRKVEAGGYYFSPIRETTHVVAGSVIVGENQHARDVAAVVDGRVQYVFVDTEKKIPPIQKEFLDLCNIEREVREVVKTSKVHTFKANDITVDSVDTLLAQIVPSIGGLKVAIIGAGNLGSKLALKLVERGAHVYVTRRDEKKLNAIVTALNIIKPAETVAQVHGTTDNHAAACDANIIIGTSSGPAASIDLAMIESVAPNALVMDGGKGCLTTDALDLAEKRGLDIYRFDVQAGFEGAVAQILRMEAILTGGMGRKVISGVPVVSAGLFARKDEIIVDNINRPTVVYGISGGHGDLVRHLSAQQLEQLSILKSVVLSHGGVDNSPHHALQRAGK